jgi:aerobic C4-dicarboxylate transport protein
VLFGFALHGVGERARPVFDFVDRFSSVMFRIVGMIMRLAPLGLVIHPEDTLGARHRAGKLVPLVNPGNAPVALPRAHRPARAL